MALISSEFTTLINICSAQLATQALPSNVQVIRPQKHEQKSLSHPFSKETVRSQIVTQIEI